MLQRRSPLAFSVAVLALSLLHPGAGPRTAFAQETATERALTAAERAEEAAQRAEVAAEVAQEPPPAQSGGAAGSPGAAPAPAPQTPVPQGLAPPAGAPAPGEAPPAATAPAPAPAAPAGQAQGGVPSPAQATAPAPQGAQVPAQQLPAPTQDDLIAIEQVKQPVIYLKAALDSLEKEIEAVRDSDEELAKRRIEIDALIAGGDLFLESLQPRYKAVSAQIQKLGPPPGEGAPPESGDIAAERGRLNLFSAEIDGAIKATGLVQYRARELLSKVQEFRAALFTKELFRRYQSPLSLSTWTGVVDALPSVGNELRWIWWRSWRSAEGSLGWVAALSLAAVGAYFLLRTFRRRIMRARLTPTEDQRPDFFERAATAGWVAPLNALPIGLAATLLTVGLDNLGIWFLDSVPLTETVLPAIAVVVAVNALARAVLQPRRPFWRLVDLADRPSRALTTVVTGIGVVYSVDLVLQELMRVLAVPLQVNVAEAFLASVALAGLLFTIVATRFDRMEEPAADASGLAQPPASDEGEERGRVSIFAPWLLKVPLLGVAVFILLTSLFGYIALGQFVADQVIVTGSVVVLVLLLHLAIRAFTGQDQGTERALGRVVHSRLGLNETQTSFVTNITAVALNILLALVAMPLVMVTWGFSLADTLAWLKTLVFGFEIGQIRISPVEILAALALFAGLLFATRVVQRWLTATVLRPPRLDAGVANSIEKAVGYAGFAIAVLVALSYVGLDITNVAIIAGALSVGIGFGLQSIFNNFVSGLILLIERPIKVGDLVVINGQWGRVRNIDVRATEIETVERATLIVPNSELISQTVTNWTHRNALARVTIRVSVAYESDPETVRNVLQEVASQCAIILQQPKPDVVFENFGASGLDFALHTVVSDIAKSFAAQTDLRIRIFNAFREAGIEIPYAQMDVRFRDIEALRTIIEETPSQRPRVAADVKQGSSDTASGGAVPLRDPRPSSR